MKFHHFGIEVKDTVNNDVKIVTILDPDQNPIDIAQLL